MRPYAASSAWLWVRAVALPPFAAMHRGQTILVAGWITQQTSVLAIISRAAWISGSKPFKIFSASSHASVKLGVLAACWLAAPVACFTINPLGAGAAVVIR